MQTERELLTKMLDMMDVPKNRYADYNWLHRNLGINNYQHPCFIDAMELIRRLRQSEYLDGRVDL